MRCSRCLSQIDAADESLNKWKASLGLGAGGAELEGPRVVVLSLSLHAEGRAAGPIILDLSSPEAVAAFKKNPVTIKVSLIQRWVEEELISKYGVGGVRVCCRAQVQDQWTSDGCQVHSGEQPRLGRRWIEVEELTTAFAILGREEGWNQRWVSLIPR
jgi:hypothetical protein